MSRDIRRREERLPEPEYRRLGWEKGPWDDEPDLIEWRNDELPGLALLVVRSYSTGALCGYVAVSPGHPLHGRPYQELELEVHGGLTYAGSCAGHICHVPAPGEPDDVWWLGFDCGHAFDVSPGLDALVAQHAGAPRIQFRYAHYRPLEYVMTEAEKLGEQVLHGQKHR